MRRYAFIGLGVGLLALSACASAQQARLDLPSFRHLESKAVDSVDFSFGRMLTRPASWFIEEDEPDGRELKRILRGITSVRIRSYEFDKDYVYSKSDIDDVRRQLARSGWSQVLQVRDRKSDEDVDVYMAVDDDKALGFALVASEPREFTIIHVVGDVDLNDVQKLGSHFRSNRRDRSGSRHADDEMRVAQDR